MNDREDVDLVLKRRACRDRTLIDLLSLDDDILAVESDVKGGVHILQLSLDKQETRLLSQDNHHSDTVRCVVIDSRHRVIYTGGEDGLVKGRECLLDHDGHLVEKRIPSRTRHRSSRMKSDMNMTKFVSKRRFNDQQQQVPPGLCLFAVRVPPGLCLFAVCRTANSPSEFLQDFVYSPSEFPQDFVYSPSEFPRTLSIRHPLEWRIRHPSSSKTLSIRRPLDPKFP